MNSSDFSASASADGIWQKVFRTIKDNGMFVAGDHVLVGVSGGADSMCLLHLLVMHRSELAVRISAAHVNHGIRGADADADEAFVREWCNILNVPLFCKQIDVPAQAQQRKQSTELCAREMRYDFFYSLSPDKIATAHTLSDACETLLMNLARGTTLHGLCGIPPKRDKIVRPLICVGRKETEAYCRTVGIPFVTDQTNLSDAYTRNRYRLHVLPDIARIHPAYEDSFRRCMDSLKTDDDYLSKEAEKVLCSHISGDDRLILSGIRDLHPAIRRRVLHLFLGLEAEYKHILLLEAHLTDPGFTLQIPGDQTARVCDDCIVLKLPTGRMPAQEPLHVPKTETGDISFGKYKIRFRTAVSGFNDYFPDAVDYRKVDEIIEVRSRTSGDRIMLPKRKCTKTLKKLFSEMKIPIGLRESIPVLADSRGVIWVAGVGAERTRLPDASSDKILIISMESEQ